MFNLDNLGLEEALIITNEYDMTINLTNILSRLKLKLKKIDGYTVF